MPQEPNRAQRRNLARLPDPESLTGLQLGFAEIRQRLHVVEIALARTTAILHGLLVEHHEGGATVSRGLADAALRNRLQVAVTEDGMDLKLEAEVPTRQIVAGPGVGE